MTKGIATVIGTIVLLFAAQTARSESCEEEAKRFLKEGFGYEVTLVSATKCIIEGSRDQDEPSGLVQQFNNDTPDTNDDAKRFSAIIGTTTLLQQEVANGVNGNLNKELWQRIDTRLTEERRLLSTIPNGDLDEIHKVIFPSNFWNMQQGRFGTVDGKSVSAWGTTCDDAVKMCPAFDDRMKLIRVVVLGTRLGKYIDTSVRVAHTNATNLLNAKWRSYFHDTLPQYWWEVLANGYRMKDECTKDSKTGIQTGFCNVPTNQLILVHPEAGLEWTSSASSSDELKPVVVIEAIGYNRWNWGGNGSAVKNQRGVSLVAAYGDRNQSSDWSYGAMLHWNGYNLAVTTNSNGDVGVLFNVALAGSYFGRREKYIDYLKEIQKPAFTDVLTGNWPPDIPK